MNKKFYLVKNKINDLYLKSPSGRKDDFSGIWTDKLQSIKSYNTIGLAKLAVSNAEYYYKVKYSDMVIEEYESILMKTYEMQ